MIIIAGGLIQRTYSQWLVSIPALLLGGGVLGVGLFPGNNATFHPIFALLAFTMGGLAAISSYRVVTPPFKFLVPVLGVTALVFLFAANAFIPFLGRGGTERWIAYPVVLWMTSFGGYLLASEE
jgi:hypothetical membrane protein